MEVQIDLRVRTGISKTLFSAIEVCSVRIARKVILKRYCPEGHPVIEVENQLVEMAAAKLIEIVGSKDPNLEEAALMIRNSAAIKVRNSDEEDQTKMLAIMDIMKMKTNEILPFELKFHVVGREHDT
jgi:hypothetical protein